MANSSESASNAFGLSNGPALGLGFLPPHGHYMAYFVLYEAYETVTHSREYFMDCNVRRVRVTLL